MRVTRTIRSLALLTVAAAAALVTAGCNSASGSFKLTTASMTIRAGESFPLTVTAVDKSGNVITGYHNAAKLSYDDNSPSQMFTFNTSEQGVHQVMATINSVGTHTITASEVGNSNFKGTIVINVLTGIKMVMTGVAPSTTTSTPMTITVKVLQMDGSPLSGYAGTVSFSSSDAVAYLPASYTFTAADGGSHDFVSTFNTVGAQMLTSVDTGDGSLTATAMSDVTGPAYYWTDPTAGKIRLVHNAAMSTPTLAVLDLIATVDLTGYFVGFDLAADATKLAPGADLITAGTALDPGSAPAAIKGAIPTAGPLANALVTGLSQKASGTGAVATDATISAGKLFYTIKLPLKAGAAGGTIIDGTDVKNQIRAGLRNRVGMEVVGVADFGFGKLVYTP